MIEISFPEAPPIISELLKKATVAHNAGEYDQAVDFLRSAYNEITKTPIDYSVSTFLRLPLYLQAAGRNQEAWDEFNDLLQNGHPNQLDDSALIPIYQSDIYDKMRLFLHRTKRYDWAVIYGVYSYISWLIGMHLQKRHSYFKKFYGESELAKIILKLLKKDGRVDLLDKTVNAVCFHVNLIPTVDFKLLGEDLERILLPKGILFDFQGAQTPGPESAK